MSKKTHREQVPRAVQCMCGQATCGVGKNAGQLKQAFFDKFGDGPDMQAVNRRVLAMVPAYHGHQGR